MIKAINDGKSSTLEIEKATLEQRLGEAYQRIGALEAKLKQNLQPSTPVKNVQVVEKVVEVEKVVKEMEPFSLERLHLVSVGDVTDSNCTPSEVSCSVKINNEEEEKQLTLAVSVGVASRLIRTLKGSK